MTQFSNTLPVLVLDGDMTPALTITRSLARRGLEVDIASHIEKPLASYSRMSANTLIYPDPLTKKQDFLTWCRATMAENKYQLIIPVTERTLVPMQGLTSQPGGEKLAIAPVEALEIALDKKRTLTLAKDLGIPTPLSKLVETQQQLADVIADFTPPVVIKPARSIGENKHGRKQLRVEYAFSQEELLANAKQFLQYGAILLQEYFQGQGVGVELIANQGEIVYAFQHLRLHEVPLTGGGSSLRVSVPLEPALLDASQKLIKALNWHGVAMVEFKWNPDTKAFALMEINGRFWGSLPLAVAAGADFPAMLYELMTQGKVEQRPAATVGVYGRKLSSDIYWYEQVLRRDAPAGLVKFPNARTTFRDLLRIFSPRHSFDIQHWRDPIPGLNDLGKIISSYSNRVIGLAQDRLALQRQRKAWRSGRAESRLRTADQVLFLCYGNINRSALAEAYIKSIVPDTTTKYISAGYHDEEGRPADPAMVDVASATGIDLQNWSSKKITHDMVNASDVILAMEQKHYDYVAEHFPEAASKTFLLGMADETLAGYGEIADPYGKPKSAYERCVKEVTANVRAIVKILNKTENV